MLFELSEQVVKNMLAFLGRTDIKGAEWRGMAEIEQALNNPVKPEPRKPPPAPKNETTTRGKPPKSKP